VTHDPRVLRFADRIVQIEDGLLVDERSGEREPLRLPRAATLPSLGGHAAQ
jgi:putative ABC transport system ATP-binding protein